MGLFNSKKKEESLEGEEVNFNHFQVLRAIGRGSFGKVCIVQKRDTKQMYAMKYVNKEQCQERDALSNVFREIEILAALSHPFLVNLWFSFQDAEDMFLVVELLVGGDLRYHLLQGVEFSDHSVRLFLLEAASALVYLHQRNIIHRDIKPDNLLLDEEGHVHLTDFNIATVVKPGQLATSMSGTRPYMAPEVYECAADECLGYGAAVDWWSLGVSAYEVRQGRRPYDIHSSTALAEIRRMFQTTPRFSSGVNPGLAQLILGLLMTDPTRRIQSLEEVYKIPFMAEVTMQDVLNKKTKPTFTPPKDHLNCDPTFELEEMIIESRPLHKKKQRLSKQKSLTHTSQSGNTDAEEEKKYEGMLVFNRELEERKRERERREREREEREKKWQEELEESMRLSDPTGHGCSFMGSQSSTPVKTKLGGHEGSAEVNRSSPLTPPTLTEADLQVTKNAVSPSSVRARIARSPKVKVRGATVTIESPRSSSSSLTKSSTNYLQERLKELQADQRRVQTNTSTDDVTQSASQSQPRERKQAANERPEKDKEDLSANHVAGIRRTQEEEEEEVIRPRSGSNNNNNNDNNNGSGSNKGNSSNKKNKRRDKRR